MTKVSFILYTAGNTPNSVQAVSNLRAICLEHFLDHHRIEIVDLLRDPQRGLADGIIVTPTLVKIAPEPQQMIMGNLSDTRRVLRAISWDGPINGVGGSYDVNLNEAGTAEKRAVDQKNGHE